MLAATSVIGRERGWVTLGTGTSSEARASGRESGRRVSADRPAGTGSAADADDDHGAGATSGARSGSSQSGMAIMRWVSGFQQACRVSPVATGSPVSA